jgi:hypothetical protein
MRKRTVLFFVVLAASIFMSGQVFAQWTQAKGGAYNQLGLSYYKTTQKFTTLDINEADGEIIGLEGPIITNPTEEFTSTKITYYSEYGITDDLTVILSVPYDWQRSNDVMRYTDEEGPSGVGDIKVGLRHKLVDNVLGSGVIMAAQVEVKIPEAYKYGDPVTKLSLGDGQYDYEFALQFGRGLGAGYLWVDTRYVYRDYNHQNDPEYFKPSDKIKVGIGGGYRILSWLSVGGSVYWNKSTGNAVVNDDLRYAFYPAGKKSTYGDVVIIKEDLALEGDSLSAGMNLEFDVSSLLPFMKDTFPYKGIRVSYDRDLPGFGDLRTKDSALGETWGITFVFPGEGLFPVNLFAQK